MPQPRVQTLLQTQLSRQEFLKLSLLAAGSVLGFGSLLRLAMGKQQAVVHGKPGKGYGSNPYGK